jgi:hypothetical protein
VRSPDPSVICHGAILHRPSTSGTGSTGQPVSTRSAVRVPVVTVIFNGHRAEHLVGEFLPGLLRREVLREFFDGELALQIDVPACLSVFQEYDAGGITT